MTDDRDERAAALKTIYDGLKMALDGAYAYQLASLRIEQTRDQADAAAPITGPTQHRKKLWTVAEIAEYLRVEPRTVYVWVREKGMPARKAGDELRFDPDEVDRWTIRDRETEKTIEKARVRVIR
jgi:excisionase family DNA binding protein